MSRTVSYTLEVLNASSERVDGGVDTMVCDDLLEFLETLHPEEEVAKEKHYHGNYPHWYLPLNDNMQGDDKEWDWLSDLCKFSRRWPVLVLGLFVEWSDGDDEVYYFHNGGCQIEEMERVYPPFDSLRLEIPKDETNQAMVGNPSKS